MGDLVDRVLADEAVAFVRGARRLDSDVDERACGYRGPGRPVRSRTPAERLPCVLFLAPSDNARRPVRCCAQRIGVDLTLVQVAGYATRVGLFDQISNAQSVSLRPMGART